MEKYVYLCSPIIGERLRIPVNQGVNSGVFGRAQWFVNRWFINGIARFQHSLDLQPGLDSRWRVYVCKYSKLFFSSKI